MPRHSASKNPPAVQVLVSNPENSQTTEAKPPEPREEKTPTWFWDKLAEIPLEDWKNNIYAVWVMRNGDSRVPMAAGEKGYLDMFLEPITPATIKQKYGGGKYTAVLNKRGRAETSHNFEIEGRPLYDLRREQVSAAPAAATAAQSLDSSNIVSQFVTVLREELQHARESGQGSNSANEATVEMLSNAAKKSAEILLAQTPQAGNPATMIKEMVSAMKDLGFGGAGQQQGSTLGALVKELTPLITMLTPFLEKFLKPTDPIAQLTQFKALMDAVDGLRGGPGAGGSGSRGTTTNDLILEGIKLLPSVIDNMQAQKAAAALQASPQRLAPLAAPPTSAAHSRVAPPLFAPPAASGIPPGAAPMHVSPLRTRPINQPVESAAVAPAAAETVGAPTMAADPGTASPEQFDGWVKARVVEFIFLGFEGSDVIEWLGIVKPDLIADIDKYTNDQIESLFALDPILMRALEHPNWKRTLHDAKIAAADWIADEAEEDDELQEIPEPVTQFKN